MDPDAISALLDYYNNRATSFASLLTASIFGLVTLSAIIQFTFDKSFLINPNILTNPIIQIVVSVILYLLFSIACYHTLICYSYYTGLADKIKTAGLQTPYISDLKNMKLLEEKDGEKKFRSLIEIITETDRDHSKSFPKNLLQKPHALKISIPAALALLAVFIYWYVIIQLIPI